MDDETTYTIENAKSGRSSCKKCKEKIGKGELRMGTEKSAGEYNMTSWHHPECFFYPRKLTKSGISVESFVESTLQDNTDEAILSDQALFDDIVEKIKMKGKKKAAGDGGEGGGAAGDAEDNIKAIKRTLEQIRKEDAAEDDDDDDDAPKKKKAKASPAGAVTAEERAKAEAYAVYESFNNDALKDICRWNRQMVGGKKAMLLTRVIDGQMHGRLARCPVCLEGKLKLVEEDGGSTVACSGTFDEETNSRVNCFYKAAASAAPRFQPFFTEEPTEEEEEEVTRQIDEAKAGGAGTMAAAESASSDLSKLASGIVFDLSDKAGVQKAASDMIAVCTEGKVDLPAERAKMEVGRMIVSNKGQSPAEVMKLIVEKFGFAAVKEEQKKAKHEAAGAVCGRPSNVAVMEAIMELSGFYYKEGNSNAGGTYTKVANAIKGLDFEITADNAKGLGKGKTKVANIGKGSGDKIHEFITTGTMAKLEEKRAAA